jgi:hypothetical protein
VYIDNSYSAPPSYTTLTTSAAVNFWFASPQGTLVNGARISIPDLTLPPLSSMTSVQVSETFYGIDGTTAGGAPGNPGGGGGGGVIGGGGGIYGIGGNGASTGPNVNNGSGPTPYINTWNPSGSFSAPNTPGYLVVIETITGPTQPALTVVGNEVVTGSLNVYDSITVAQGGGTVFTAGTAGSHVYNTLQVDGAATCGATLAVTGPITGSASLNIVGTSNLNGNTTVGTGSFNAWMTVGNAPIGGTPAASSGDLNVTGTVRGTTISASQTITGTNASFPGTVNSGPIIGSSTLNIAGVSTLATVNSGTIVSSGTITGTDVIASSDVRTKNNIVTIDSALDKVMRMRGVFFERNVEPGEKRVGVIAQEVEKILPEVVYTDENGLKSVSYGSIIGLLIEAIKEQQEVIKKVQS